MKARRIVAALAGILALATVFTQSAGAVLPEAKESLANEYPVVAKGGAKGEAIWVFSTAITALTANEVSLKLTLEGSGPSMHYDLTLQETRFSGTKECNTPGAEDGQVLISGEARAVWVRLPPEGGLVSAIMLTMPGKVTIECGPLGKPELKDTVEGGVLGELEAASGVELTEFGLNLKCSEPGNGKQQWKQYFNDEEEKVKVVLKANFGLGNEAACGEVKEPLSLALSERMIEFLNL